LFTSALRSNVRDADLIENSFSVEICLRSRCLATVCVNTPQYGTIREWNVVSGIPNVTCRWRRNQLPTPCTHYTGVSLQPSGLNALDLKINSAPAGVESLRTGCCQALSLFTILTELSRLLILPDET
jgi:hypothetical protein